MIFLPVEDALYLFFTKTLHRGQPAVQQQQVGVIANTRYHMNSLYSCVVRNDTHLV